MSVYYAVTKDRQVLNVHRVECVANGGRQVQLDGSWSSIGAVAVKVFVSTPATN